MLKTRVTLFMWMLNFLAEQLCTLTFIESKYPSLTLSSLWLKPFLDLNMLLVGAYDPHFGCLISTFHSDLFFFFLIIWTCHFDTCWWRTWILNGPKSTLGKARSDLCMVVCLSPNFWVCFRSYMKCACINHCQYIYSHGFSLYFYDEQIDQKESLCCVGASSPLIGGLPCMIAFHLLSLVV